MTMFLYVSNPPTGKCRSYISQHDDVQRGYHIHHSHLHDADDPRRFNGGILQAWLDERGWPDDAFLIPDYEFHAMPGVCPSMWQIYEGPNSPDRRLLFRSFRQCLQWLKRHAPDATRSLWGLPRVYPLQDLDGAMWLNRDLQPVMDASSVASPMIYLKHQITSTPEVRAFREWAKTIGAVCEALGVDRHHIVPQVNYRILDGALRGELLNDVSLQCVRETIQGHIRCPAITMWCAGWQGERLWANSATISEVWMHAADMLRGES
ncbi:MAG TPA: hypothetical protein VMX97_09990 [Hyphomicrobiaceae bacterium]|nr:hypothetical protein [Hyphomicrobiaceae bacterium]